MDAFIHLRVMFIGNLLGAVAFGYLMFLCFRNTDAYARFLKLAALRAKDFVGAPMFEMFLTTFIAGFFCGLCVYMAVRNHGKIRLTFPMVFELVFFVFLFVCCGFEHCIPNMFYLSGASTWNRNAVIDIILVVLGNSLGTIPGILF